MKINIGVKIPGPIFNVCLCGKIKRINIPIISIKIINKIDEKAVSFNIRIINLFLSSVFIILPFSIT